VSRITTICLGFVAILLGIAFDKQNVAFTVGLAFGVAAAATFPVLILSMYWKGLTTRGAIAGGYGGLFTAVVLVVLSKSVWVDVFHFGSAIFPYTQSALFAMPVAFLLAFIVSKVEASERAKKEIAAFEDQYVRAQTGLSVRTATLRGCPRKARLANTVRAFCIGLAALRRQIS
jgi:cation/acetate symporter